MSTCLPPSLLRHPAAWRLAMVWLLLSVLLGAGRSVAGEYVVENVLVDGQPMQRAPDATGLIVPAKTRQVILQIRWKGEPDEAPRLHSTVEQNGRVVSRELPVAKFYVGPLLSDAKGDEVLNQVQVLKGKSAGWSGSVWTSGFERRELDFAVPPKASMLRFILSSGGDYPAHMGWLAVRNCVMELTPRREGDPVTRLQLMPPAEGSAQNWLKHGSQPSMAKVLDSRDSGSVLALEDDRATHWCGWVYDGISLENYRRVKVFWEQCYSIGIGGNRNAILDALPKGESVMVFQPQSLEGAPQGTPVRLPVMVLPLLHERPAFRVAVLMAALLLAAWLIRLMFRRRLRTRLAALERERELHQERSRIARDLHDHMGASLTQIALLSDLIQTKPSEDPERSEQLGQMFDLAQGLTRQVDEMVWAVNPGKDNLDSLVTYLVDHAQGYLASAGIRCRLQLPSSLPHMEITAATRYHLLLVVKEALHNVVKHAAATEVVIRITLDEGRLSLSLEDNGRGMPEDLKKGDGLDNMQKRMSLIRGSLKIHSGGQAGTRLVLTLPLQATP